MQAWSEDGTALVRGRCGEGGVCFALARCHVPCCSEINSEQM